MESENVLLTGRKKQQVSTSPTFQTRWCKTDSQGVSAGFTQISDQMSIILSITSGQFSIRTRGT